MSDFPVDYPPFTPEHHDRQSDGSAWTPEAVLSHGGSCVVGPLGNFVTEPVWDKEQIVYAVLKKDELVESRVLRTSSKPWEYILTYESAPQMDFDPVGSYSRPDILSVFDMPPFDFGTLMMLIVR